jgi:DNA adenine methylase
MFRESGKGFNIPHGWNRTVSVPGISHWKDIAELIRDVHFEASDFREALMKVETGDFCYIDPPYFPETPTSFVGYTLDGFNADAHTDLFQAIRDMSPSSSGGGGHVLMSNSNTGPVANTFADLVIQPVVARRAINALQPGSKTKEVFVRNYTN